MLSVTNRYEGDVNISFVNLADDKVSNLSNFEANARIEFEYQDSVIIDRQDNSKVVPAQLKQTDEQTKGFVCFRRDNKIAVKCLVTPMTKPTNKEPDYVKCIFGLKCSINMPESSSPQIQNSSSGSKENFTNSVITHHVFVDFGPLKLENGLKVVPKPRYIDDCLKTLVK